LGFAAGSETKSTVAKDANGEPESYLRYHFVAEPALSAMKLQWTVVTRFVGGAGLVEPVPCAVSGCG